MALARGRYIEMIMECHVPKGEHMPDRVKAVMRMHGHSRNIDLPLQNRAILCSTDLCLPTYLGR